MPGCRVSAARAADPSSCWDLLLLETSGLGIGFTSGCKIVDERWLSDLIRVAMFKANRIEYLMVTAEFGIRTECKKT